MSAGAVALQFKRCRPTMKRSGALRTHSRDGMLPMLAQRSRAGFGFMMLNRASLPSISSQERGQGGAQAAAGRPRRRHRDLLAEQQKHVGSCALWQPACTQFTNVATVVKTGLWLRKCAGSHVKQSGESGSTAKGALPLCTLSIKNCQHAMHWDLHCRLDLTSPTNPKLAVVLPGAAVCRARRHRRRRAASTLRMLLHKSACSIPQQRRLECRQAQHRCQDDFAGRVEVPSTQDKA